MDYMDKKYVYVIEQMTGQYEDRMSHNVECYFNLDKAQAECDRLNKEMRDIQDKYDKIDYDVDALKDDIFLFYLKEVNEELYNEVSDAEKRPDSNEWFDWDKYYDERDKFYIDDDTFIEYAKKYGCTDQQLDDIETVDYMSDELGYDAPYYYVSSIPVEIKDYE